MALLRRTIPVKPTHVEPEQKAMSAFIRNFDYPGLVSQIESAESNKAVKLNQSRLQGEWKKDAIHLLAQLKPDILQSILDNTLPQRANRGSSTRIREVATNRTTTDKTLDPVIYINYLADKYGQGMTFKQFRLFLDALGCAAGGYLDDPDRFIKYFQDQTAIADLELKNHERDETSECLEPELDHAEGDVRQ
ncbi:hypothetical protein LTR09_009697 [Extremus antarcticus]|uniref:Uncharacterized protein n=1 Tax=Extremus antarcticus TaxID=702011 RepID=A0AAJ0DF73_9PEZI|nr:hypothetical protein LTR09_009697 [Extremus antarcticus]